MKIVVQATIGHELIYQSCNPVGTKAHKFHHISISEPKVYVYVSGEGASKLKDWSSASNWLFAPWAIAVVPS